MLLREIIEDINIRRVERLADKIWRPLNVDVKLPQGHFQDRLSRPEHQAQPISDEELLKLLRQERQQHGEKIADLSDKSQAVMKDVETNINVPFIIKDRSSDKKTTKQLIAKTILRKPDFSTSNDVYQVPTRTVKTPKVRDTSAVNLLKKYIMSMREELILLSPLQVSQRLDVLISRAANNSKISVSDLMDQWQKMHQDLTPATWFFKKTQNRD